MNSNELETFYPTSVAKWREWLEKNHEKEDSIWVLYYKVKSGQPSITWDEAVNEALCFGWIDSTKKTIDSESYIQYFSKRKPKSNWSRVNKDKVDLLIKEGKMRPSGLQSIEIARKNGSWELLDSIEELVVPDDLKAALDKSSNYEFYENLSRSKKKLVLYWVVVAKKAETRQKRIKEVVSSFSNEKMPKQLS